VVTETRSFLKKAPKNLCPLAFTPKTATPAKWQKFFGAFFQKSTAFFPFSSSRSLRPARNAPCATPTPRRRRSRPTLFSRQPPARRRRILNHG
jgi:hypothetical protein